MGLHLVSTDGHRVRQIKTWVLRCHACFKYVCALLAFIVAMYIPIRAQSLPFKSLDGHGEEVLPTLRQCGTDASFLQHQRTWRGYIPSEEELSIQVARNNGTNRTFTILLIKHASPSLPPHPNRL